MCNQFCEKFSLTFDVGRELITKISSPPYLNLVVIHKYYFFVTRVTRLPTIIVKSVGKVATFYLRIHLLNYSRRLCRKA